MKKERLDKIIAGRGYCTRKEVRFLISAGRIKIAGEEARDATAKVDPDSITLDDRPLDIGPGITLILHKPVGYICSKSDEGLLVYSLLPPRYCLRNPALSTVGRLDKDTSGLLLLTDDGQLSHRISAPKKAISKTYAFMLESDLEGHEADIFASGTLTLRSEETPLAPARLDAEGPRHGQITITEGRYHQVRRMFAAVGQRVATLQRTAIGNLQLDVPEGQFRIAAAADIEKIFA